MTTPNRAALLTKIHKALKKHYKVVPPRGEQPLLETLLFAACLENTHLETAEKVFATVKASFFDWNEVRVSTVKELAEVMHAVAEPAAAGARLKGILQSVFESDYTFELEPLKKKNLGEAVKRLQKLEGSTHFNVAYATQVALGGHSIPVDQGTMNALVVLGVLTEAEAAHGVVPGMERAIPKSKGTEFGALLHELGADYFASPFSPAVRDLLLSISPDAKDRFPKRATKKVVEERPAPAPEPVKKKAASDKATAEKAAAAGKKESPAKKPAERGHKADHGHKADGARKGDHGHKSSAEAKKQPASAKKKAPVKPLAKRKPR